MFADPMDRAYDNRDNRRLDAEENGTEHGPLDRQPGIGPSEREHQNEARQHEAQPGEDTPQTPLGTDAEMDAQLMRFRSWQHLHYGQELVKPVAWNPAFLIDQLAPDHGDLRHRATKCHHAETKEAEEQRGVAQLRWPSFVANQACGAGVLDVCHHPAPCAPRCLVKCAWKPSSAPEP